jgi:hypothetical protein
MSAFLLEVVHDLRRKRMLPVAIVLGLALVLVPIFLLESPGDARPAPTGLPVVGSPPGSGLPPVQLERASQKQLSRLDAFSSKDPFGRPYRRRAESTAEGLTGDPAELAQSALGGGGLGSPAGSSSSAFPPLVGGGSAGGGGSSGGASPSGGSSGSGSPESSSPSGSTDEPSKAETPKRRRDPADASLFTFRLDLRFGPTGKVTDYPNVKRLSSLPSEKLPLLVFLGANEKGTEAVFLLDTARLRPEGGEERCRPSPERCAFLHLEEGSEDDVQTFLDEEGKRFHLRVIDIELARVKPGEDEEEPAGADGDTGSSDGSEGASGSESSEAETTGSPEEDGDSKDEGRDGELPSSFPDLFDLILGRR